MPTTTKKVQQSKFPSHSKSKSLDLSQSGPSGPLFLFVLVLVTRAPLRYTFIQGISGKKTLKAQLRISVIMACLVGLSACGNALSVRNAQEGAVRQASRTTGAETVAVNRYLWAASLDVLSFLPVQSVDPFTGVITTGYGTPPGGSRAYRATVYITDPALDARALNVALQSRNGPVAVETQRVIEDAILTRARQLRAADGNL